MPSLLDIARKAARGKGENPIIALGNVVPIRPTRPDLVQKARQELERRPGLAFWADVDASGRGPFVVIVVADRDTGRIRCREILVSRECFDLEFFLKTVEKHSA